MRNIRWPIFCKGSLVFAIHYLSIYHLINVYYYLDYDANLIRKIIITILFFIYCVALGKWIEFIILPQISENKDGLIGNLINIIIYGFVFSLINDLLVWKRIFTTFISIINIKVIMNMLKDLVLLKLPLIYKIPTPANNNDIFYIILRLASIIAIILEILQWGYLLLFKKQNE
jgi:hypothetical protein